MPGVEFDSFLRDPPPRCHPGTRMEILDDLHNWIDNAQRTHQLLWLNGPAGVGKSAIVQTLAEDPSTTPKLGATLFFSRSNKCKDPAIVFPTIAYQLAVRIPPYREYLRRKMTDDRKLLEKGMEHHFRVLIVEPFTTLWLMPESRGWAILLDGLDECDGEDTQVLIVKLVSRFSLRYPEAPLVWIIASRPEAHLSLAFNSDDVIGTFWALNVPANSDQACRDVEQYLRAKFEEIRYKYRDIIPGNTPWPTERDITRVWRSALGLFVFASTVIRFVDDPHLCNPISQLAIIVALPLTENPQVNPLSTLHVLYTTILDNVPKSLLPTLKLLLGCAMKTPLVGPDEDVDEIPLVFNATLFGLQQHTVYSALRKLHSVIKVPPPEDSGRQDIRFYHASFADYLRDVSKSGEYAIDFDY